MSELLEVAEKIRNLSDEAVALALAYDALKIKPIAHTLLASDGYTMAGASSGLDLLKNVDKVDLVAYLIKHLDITLDDIEEAIQLSDETRFMMRRIKRDRIL